ncbi:MAG: bifunctional oligoribonuclease/PAP phosphatase NrnA [Patescibacteria group bacterium]|jgi:phosphoesterase RecJ-like protein
MDIRFSFDSAREALARAKKILAVTHQRPDGDALGSSSAFVNYCLEQGIEVAVYCADPVPEKYSFLAGAEKFTTDTSVFAADHDLCVVFDCGGLNQTGVVDLIASRPARTRLIGFDHHLVNDRYGDINVVDPQASSASEVFYRFLRHINAEISEDIATCLLTGIYYDTTAFSNSATNRSALEAASDLLRRGADANLITERVFRSRPLSSLRLYGTAMARLKHDKRLDIASTALFLSDFEPGKAQEATDDLYNLLGSILDAGVVLVLKEGPGGQVRGSFRAAADVDVSSVAKALGGGGHRKAAGFSVPGKICEGENCWRVE